MSQDKVIESIKREIEDLLSAKRSSTGAGLTEDISPGIAGAPAGGLEWLLEELAVQARVDVNSVPVRSTRPIWGPLITLIKRAVRKSTYWLYQPLFEQVSRFNLAVLDVLARTASKQKSAGKSFGEWAAFYDREITEEDLQGNVEHHAFFLGKVEELAKRQKEAIPSLLEVGIGTATMSIYLSRRFYKVVGIDNDPFVVANAIQTNKRLGGYATYFCMDAFLLPEYFKSDLFDVAFSQGTLEHFDNEALKKLIEAQLSVAKKVAFSVPSVYWTQRDFGNERLLSLEEWERILKSCGFKVEELAYYPQDAKYHVYGCVVK
jgi:2-polyprenyl-3-methyl-5-hydroxy-6-metoxy-1,4-benzoquinol methylase